MYFISLLLLMFSPPLDLPGGRACRFLAGGLGPLVAVVSLLQLKACC